MVSLNDAHLNDFLSFFFCYLFLAYWPFGSYGYYYDEMCGHCKDLTQCSPYTGICLTGCSAGYFGPSCKEGFSLLSYTYSLVREDSMYIYVSFEIIAVLLLFEIEKEIDGVV